MSNPADYLFTDFWRFTFHPDFRTESQMQRFTEHEVKQRDIHGRRLGAEFGWDANNFADQKFSNDIFLGTLFQPKSRPIHLIR